MSALANLTITPQSRPKTSISAIEPATIPMFISVFGEFQ
jgi:hypothetical protein